MTIIAVTSRLLLKEFSPREAEYFYLLNADPEVIKFTGDVAFKDVEEARTFLVNYTHYQKEDYNLEKIVGRAMAANLASIRVLSKLKMKLVKSFSTDHSTWMQYELNHKDFVKL